MPDFVRRDILQIASAASALSALGPLTGTALAQSPTGSLRDIDHFIILMKENRSFDHYFGTLAGVRGYDDPRAVRADGSSIFRQRDVVNPDGHVLPFRLDTTTTSAQQLHDLSHSWEAQHIAWNQGAMDDWVAVHRGADGTKAGALTMGYHARADIPFYYALADAFTICDGYHCSVMGPTHPNRYYLMTATIDPEGKHGGPAIDNSGRHYSWETYPERLDRAGVSWRIYHDVDDYGCNVCAYFTQFQNAPKTSSLWDNAMRNRPLEELLSDIRTGNIPQVSWIVPPSTLSEHPDYLPAAGENHTHQVLKALWSNPRLWAKTALILNYDENDGQFDHVAPPTPESGAAKEYINGEPIGLGFRVPCLVISPFSRGNYVCGTTFDHTSTLRLLEARFGVEVANLSAWRRATCGDLTSAFAFDHAPRHDVPELPETAEALRIARERLPSLPRPRVPADQAMPKQESGSRLRLA